MGDMFDVNTIVQSGGLLVIGIILFAEVGLFLGFFLPGDTLLIAAGIYAKQGKLSVAAVILVAALAAIAGDNFAYQLGRRLGPKVFNKPDGVIFRKDHIDKTEAFYDKYGAKALLITHFLPVIRTFMPLLAGVGKMQFKRFVAFNAVGDTLWAIMVTLAGYYIGSRIPGIDKYILLIVLAAVLSSVLPTLYHLIKVKRRHSAAQRQKAVKESETL